MSGRSGVPLEMGGSNAKQIFYANFNHDFSGVEGRGACSEFYEELN